MRLITHKVIIKGSSEPVRYTGSHNECELFITSQLDTSSAYLVVPLTKGELIDYNTK